MFKRFVSRIVKYVMCLCFVIVFMGVIFGSGDEFLNVPGDYKFSLEHDGNIRDYLVHVPLNVEEDAPLVLVFHPFMGTPESIKEVSGFDDKSDDEGFIVVFPAGLSKSWNSFGCCGYAFRNEIDDVGFVEVMVEDIKSDFSIDDDRVYAVGFSNGGQMAHGLGAVMSESFASIAAVAGARISLVNYSRLDAVSVLHINAIDDDLSTINLANNTVEWWVDKKECVFFEKIIKEQGSYCDSYNCKNNSQVDFCVTLEGGHSWTGGTSVRYTPSTAFVATDLIWDFFENDYKNKISNYHNVDDIDVSINDTDIIVVINDTFSEDFNITVDIDYGIISRVDSNKNNIIEFTEVISYMDDWLVGNVSFSDLIEVIKLWRK